MNMVRYRTHSSYVTCLAWVLVLSFLQGCASAPPRSNPIPEVLADRAIVPGIPYARNWGDSTPAHLKDLKSIPTTRIRQRYAGIIGREHTYLAISGGGDNGAFGAGLLLG
jgi:hypothetical protein